MTPKVVYECDTCGTEFHLEEHALRCEAFAKPEVPAYLLLRIGQDVPAFGERGVTFARLDGFFIIGGDLTAGHRLRARGQYWGASQDCDEVALGLPIRALEPMCGLNFLSHVPTSDVAPQVRLWALWCREYGIEPDLTKALWWDDYSLAREVAVLEGLRSA